jgi:hypothetical protein
VWLRRADGLDVYEPELLTEDADGVQVVLHATGKVEGARRLLLEYGAYRASVLEPGAT